MSALAKVDYAPWSLSEAVVDDLAAKGAHIFADPLDGKACGAFLAEIRALRRFDESLFLSEAAFDAPSPQAVMHGGSLLEWLDGRLGFVERAPQIVEALWSLLGPDYRILEKRLVCAVPSGVIPGWVKRHAQSSSAPDIGAYVRPELRDMSYVWETGFRQDVTDAPGGPEALTLHVYLHPVTAAEAPLRLLEGSHRLGRSAFPQDLKRTGPDSWRYRNGLSGEMYVTEGALVGEAGFAVLWHPFALNGAGPAEHERISLRYRIARGQTQAAGIDQVNASLAGPLGLEG